MWNKKEMSQLDATLTRVPLTLIFDLDLWPWIFKVKLYLGNGKPDCHGMKGTGVDRMPWCGTLRKWVNWMLRWLGYLWPWIFKVKLYLGNGKPDCYRMKGTGVDSMLWCKTQPLYPRQRILLPTGWLKMSAFPSTRLVGSDNGLALLLAPSHHSVESPSMVDPQWIIWYWGSKWNLHTVCWSAVGCEWGTSSVYFGITYVCFIPSRLPVFAVEPHYLLQ